MTDADKSPQIQELDINMHMLKMAIYPTYAAELNQAADHAAQMQQTAYTEAIWQDM